MKKIILVLALLAALPQTKAIRILCTSAYTSYAMVVPDARSYAYLKDLTGRTFLRITFDDGSLLDVNAPETKIIK